MRTLVQFGVVQRLAYLAFITVVIRGGRGSIPRIEVMFFSLLLTQAQGLSSYFQSRNSADQSTQRMQEIHYHVPDYFSLETLQ